MPANHEYAQLVKSMCVRVCLCSCDFVPVGGAICGDIPLMLLKPTQERPAVWAREKGKREGGGPLLL